MGMKPRDYSDLQKKLSDAYRILEETGFSESASLVLILQKQLAEKQLGEQQLEELSQVVDSSEPPQEKAKILDRLVKNVSEGLAAGTVKGLGQG